MTATLGSQLKEMVLAAYGALIDIPEAQAKIHPSPEKWSPKQVVGHLIDSAANNHQRFVRAQFQDNLVFQGYQQDEWVAIQVYQQRPWLDLLDLWKGLNLHLAFIVDQIPEPMLTKEHFEHNLHQIAYQTCTRRSIH